MCILFILMLFFNCSSDDLENREISEIKVQEIDEELYVGDEYQLIVSHVPSDLKAPSYVWTSSNTDIASIDNTGLLIVKKAGQVIIKASLPNSNITDLIIVHVLPINLGPTSPSSPPSTPTYTGTCGARTKKGTPCKRKVVGGGRCWQHK